jgi:hypothetical protein
MMREVRRQGGGLRLPTESGLFRPAQKHRYFAVKLPEFNIVTVNQLPGLLFGGLVILAEKVNGSEDVAVVAP